MIIELQKNGFLISTNKRRLQLSVIHDFLSKKSYWASGIPLSIVKKSISNSLCFGIYIENKQVGFARVISDKATFGYLADVFILDEFRGKGLSKYLMEFIIQHPDLQGFRRWQLATLDAHNLYKQFGFGAIAHPERAMEIVKNDLYLSC